MYSKAIWSTSSRSKPSIFLFILPITPSALVAKNFTSPSEIWSSAYLIKSLIKQVLKALNFDYSMIRWSYFSELTVLCLLFKDKDITSSITFRARSKFLIKLNARVLLRLLMITALIFISKFLASWKSTKALRNDDSFTMFKALSLDSSVWKLVKRCS